MKIFNLIIFSLFSLQTALACEVELFEKVYKTQKSQKLTAKDVIKSSDCTSDVLIKVSQILSNIDGSVGTNFIAEEIEKDLNQKVTITSKKVSILDLNELAKNKLSLEKNLEFSDFKAISGLATINLNENEIVSVTCENCKTLGEKNLKLEISSPLTGQNRTSWMTAKLNARIKAVIAKRNISFQQDKLNENDFYIQEILTSQPENTLTTLENIGFFRTNKLILQNAVVSSMDILPVNLINYGTPVKAVLQSESISLERVLLPTRSARFNEIVELNGPNNKKIIGKVIDYNKVVIEL